MDLVFRDFEQYREAALGWGLEFLQLDCGPFHACLRQISAPRVSLTHFRLNRKFFQRGEIRAPGRTFAVFLDQVSPMRWRESPEVASNTLVVFPPDGSLDALSNPGFDAVSISVELPFLSGIARIHSLERAFDAIPVGAECIQTDRRIIDALRAGVRDLFEVDRCGTNGNPRRDVEGRIANLILLAIDTQFPPERSHTVRKRDRAFSAAVGMILETPDTPAIADICRRIGASERTLRYAFEEHLGVSPKQFMKAHRLRHVRRALLTGPSRPSPVLDVAAEFGFWHSGQFAADYRAMFDELPSETLLRR